MDCVAALARWFSAVTLLVAGVALLAAAPGSPDKTAADLDSPAERWREGPVRYLLAKDEDDAFRACRTEEERDAFIESFWARRDPDPSTPQNEYRDLFYARVLTAGHLFTDSTKPGWKTDRGKIYILLGPPDDLDDRKLRNISADVVLWTYRDPPPASGLSGHATIRFVRDATGEYHISSNVYLSGLENALSVAAQTQALQIESLPRARRLLDSVVAARAYLHVPVHTSHDFFRSDEGRTFTVLTLGVRPELLAGAARGPDVRFEVLARLVGTGGRPAYDLAGASGFRQGDRPAGDRGPLLFQAGAPIEPGAYTAYYVIVAGDSGAVYSHHEPLEVPDFRDGRFILSSITLASGIERLAEPRAGGYEAPFVFGGLRVTPRVDQALGAGEDLAFYYHVHGAAGDPIDGRPDLDITYRFFHAGDRPGGAAPSFAPLGQPIRLTDQRRQVQGLTMSIHQWPRGDYRLRVEVIDNLNGRKADQEVDFHVQ